MNSDIKEKEQFSVDTLASTLTKMGKDILTVSTLPALLPKMVEVIVSESESANLSIRRIFYSKEKPTDNDYNRLEYFVMKNMQAKEILNKLRIAYGTQFERDKNYIKLTKLVNIFESSIIPLLKSKEEGQIILDKCKEKGVDLNLLCKDFRMIAEV